MNDILKKIVKWGAVIALAFGFGSSYLDIFTIVKAVGYDMKLEDQKIDAVQDKLNIIIDSLQGQRTV